LRKGDELQDFYSVVADMHEAIRARVEGDIAAMDGVASSLEDQAGNPAAATKLRDLVNQKKASLDA
jgi:hypothetical protein